MRWQGNALAHSARTESLTTPLQQRQDSQLKEQLATNKKKLQVCSTGVQFLIFEIAKLYRTGKGRKISDNNAIVLSGSNVSETIFMPSSKIALCVIRKDL